MAKNKKKNKGSGAANNSGAKNHSTPKNSASPKKTKQIADRLKLGTIALLDNALTRVKERAEEKKVDYIGVLKTPDFVPTAVFIEDEESVRSVLARLGVTKKETVVEAPKVEEKNVNTGTPKKAKPAVEEDEFIKRPKPVYTEDVVEVPKDFVADFVIGNRAVPDTRNTSLIGSRFGWKYGYPQAYGYTVQTLDGANVGILSKMRLGDVWTKALRMLKSGEKLPLTKEEFDSCLDTVSSYISSKQKGGKGNDKTILVQDFLDIHELDYRELMLPQASEFAKTVKLACEYDIAETKRLAATWRKIKKYRHKVPLAVSADGLGIFSDADVGLLNSRGIKNLNKVKSHSILELKSLLLEKDFVSFIADINGAFKEDRERRRDARFKTYPFAFTTISLIFAIFIAFTYKYTIIKETLGAAILNNTFVVWLLGLAVMTVGIIRTPIRRKKHPTYCFFTKKVRRKTRHLIELSIFALAVSVLFFQRYDGYNSDVYYRFVDDDTIAIAGLVDDDTEQLKIPDSIDGYTVVSIMPRAFAGDDYLRTVEIPSSVETIGWSAFSGCDALGSISAKGGISGVKTIEDKAFHKCSALFGTDILATVETVGKNVFKGGAIESVNLPSVKNLDKSSFKNLDTLKSVTLSGDLVTVPESCFEGCANITEFSNYGGVKSIEKKAFKGCIGIPVIDLLGVETIGKNAFENCEELAEIVISDATREIGKNAFKGCNSVRVFETPFIGKNREDTAKYSFDYFINCNSKKEPFSVVLRGMTSIHSKAFEDCSSIVSVDFGDTVTEIQSGAFRNATSLKSIALPDVIVTVEEEAFYGCSNLSEIQGIEHVTYIAKSAFEGCSSISEINLSSVKTLGERAFRDCYSLSSIGEVVNLAEVSKEAFRGCYNLKTLDLSSSALRSLGEGAFRECGNLKSVSLPGTISEISAQAFRSCSNLKSFDFSNSIRSIGKEAFAYSGIVDPKFNGTLSEIGEGAFRSCGDISTLVIPASVNSIGKNAFKDCYSLKSIEAPFFGTEADGKNGSDKVFGTNHNVQYIIANGSSLTKNDMKAFKKTLTAVSISGSVSEVGEKAFKSFKYLDDVVFGSSVKTIAKEAFYGCVQLDDISLLETNVATIGESAFAESGITKFTAGESLKTIEKKAFYKSDIGTLDVSSAHQLNDLPEKLCYDCDNLYQIILSESLDTIGEAAFRYCDNLEALTLSDLENVGEAAFRDCDNLETLRISNVKTVGEAAFKNCKYLYELEIVDVATIEKEAFAKTGLKTVTIPDGCTELGKSVFKDCKNLGELTISKSVKNMGKGLFAGCNDLEIVELPYVGTDKDTAKKISYLGYYKSLERITVTDAKEIAKSAFEGCESLERLTLNEGIKEIGEKVVDDCESLDNVYLPSSLSRFKSRFPGGTVNYIDEEEQ